MRSSPSTAAKSCRNRMCRQGGKYAVWVDLFHGDRKICCRQQRFRKKCTKIPGSLALPGIFSCTPGRSRTCDLQSRSLTLYPTELRALISLIILPQQGRIVKRKCGKIAGKGIERKAERYPQGREAGENQLSKNICHIFCAFWGDFLKKCCLPSFQTGKKLLQ